ncbi:hypothetical protein NHX12_001515 [Muraenolepis orangiensis]|uniref:S100/CaBP-9k-type calcium binding subdomain domain-containing protein n=1 Tax=Muraenolepis orangiensis TaxID=630683 RepID=A0A9Q0IH98_9TELE|nr:hypothetical protein NHX12_001515 [Muraenolepis orangiensis]
MTRVQSESLLLSRRSRDSRRRGRGCRQIKGHLAEVGRSLVGFLCGLLLASLYGTMVLLLQGGELWFCVYSTASLALLASFSMGLFAGARANVTLMLPTLLSAKGRNVLVFFIMILLLSGPLQNILQNFERAADSLVCGAELAQNQTKQVMQRSASPLMPVLDSIREMTTNARGVTGRVNHFIQALTDNTRHIARTLRNVLHFLVDIGDVCNDKMGRPYRKCTRLFDEARDECVELLGIFNFLCDIVDGFRPLCGLSRAGQLFCVIPSYVGQHLRKHLSAPAVAAFQRMKQEFEFSVTADVTFDLDANSSLSLQQASQNIMEEVSREIRRFQGWAPGALLLLIDLLVFWSLHLLQDLIQGDVVARPPVLVSVEVTGEGYAADIFKDVVAAFNVLQTGNITVLSRACLMEPSAPSYSTYLLIAVYCDCCYQTLGNICVLCSRPPTFLQDQEDERDSSDEEHWEPMMSPDPEVIVESRHSYTDLELALNTLVQGFHSEAKDGSQTLDSAEFKTLVSKQMPTLAKTVGEEADLQKLLKQMGCEEGGQVSFENFWTLVQKQAMDQFGQGPNKKVVRCSCSIL